MTEPQPHSEQAREHVLKARDAVYASAPRFSLSAHVEQLADDVEALAARVAEREAERDDWWEIAGAYRSALLSGEHESKQLRDLYEAAALRASGEAPGTEEDA